MATWNIHDTSLSIFVSHIVQLNILTLVESNVIIDTILHKEVLYINVNARYILVSMYRCVE